MKNSTIIILAFTAILFHACNSTEKSTGFSVKGKITNFPEKTVVLSELTTKGLVFLDSATINEDGTFELNANVSEPTFAIIDLRKGAVVLLLDSTSQISLSVDANEPENYGVSGSEENELLKNIMLENAKYMQKVRNLETKFQLESKEEIPSAELQEQLRTEYESIMAERNKQLIAITQNISTSIVPYFVTNFLMPDADFSFYETIDKNLFATHSASKYAQEHHNRIEGLKKSAVGQLASDIVMADPYGKNIALSSFKGKIVLVDFWASWCKPCRAESPNLVKAYNAYKNKGFEIFSVSLDDNKDAWVKAINDDQLLWTHVSDLMKWNSPVVSQFNIEGIPFTLLLDRDGKIVAKNLRGTALDEKLKELMQ
jgi:thiol-disulfide isomerase/thioredoxin